MTDNTLTIFYDGHCPLCSLEMDKLKRYDKLDRIVLVNLHQENFSREYPDIDTNKAMQILHGRYQGKTLLALDVTHRAWTLVGKGVFVAPLSFPIIRQIAHLGYLLLAKYRQPISECLYQRFGIGLKTCKQGTCYEKPDRRRHWRK
ncbi:thiol-disulfide oxidoreductase DCC family protein [Paraglaciecola sp.]|uniref:thiol-disulfide oxidoreductase DCC family protein n=1 Tax=Paraglaciecola sp. TaxID=1920173 RepID=UPI003EF29844